MSVPEFSRALVLGATGGIGAAFSAHLSRHGPVTGLSREDGLDWRQPDQAEAVLGRTASDGPFDLILDATGALEIDGAGPEKQLAAIEAGAMAAQFAVNAIGPALVLKHYKSLMPREGRAVFATLVARVGSIGDNRLGGWIGYRAAKAALVQIVRTASIEIARTRPGAVVVGLHPGTVETDLSAPFAGGRDTFTPSDSAARMLAVLARLTPGDSGHHFAYDGERIAW